MNNLVKNLKLKRRAITGLARMHAFGNPSKHLKIVGVTGTNGKTTTTTLLYKVAIGLGHKAGLIGTVENMINDKRVEATHTTPDPIHLNKLLKEMKKAGCEYVFMEVSSHALDQDRVAGTNFVGGIFTNLTHDHLDYHKNIENYFGAKKKFFKMLSHDAFALANVDDAYGMRMLEGIRAKKYTYGFKNKTDFSEKLETKLLGEFNAYNTLAVFGACKLLGFPEIKIKEILKNATPPQGRFESFVSLGEVIGVVDFAHTPDALENVIKTAKGIVKNGGRIISVFGCSGDKDPFKRPIMGKIGASLSDIAFFTSDNPRSEEPSLILEAMKPDLTEEELKKVQTFVDRDEAILEAGKISKKGDIVLLMGKGHEPYQDIMGVKYPWSEMEKLKNALK